jgi:hypothetical protein
MEPMLESYNENSAIQATSQSIGNRILKDIGSAYAEKAIRSLRVVEYGCSGGRNSAAPMLSVLSPMKSRGGELRVECILEDLPSNPWHQVMAEGAKIKASLNEQMQVLCAGTSFYEQVCASDSVDIAYSYVSAHFLNGSPPLTSHVLMHEASAREKEEWERQAAQDWSRFISRRAAEVKSGGRVMICTMSRDAQGGNSWGGFSRVVWECIQQVHKQGGLNGDEVRALCIPACLRSESEILQPFESPNGEAPFDVDDLTFARTEVESERKLPSDARAKVMRKRIEAVWGGMFVRQLVQMGRELSTANHSMREVWDLFEDALRRDPEDGWTNMQVFYLTLTRK